MPNKKEPVKLRCGERHHLSHSSAARKSAMCSPGRYRNLCLARFVL